MRDPLSIRACHRCVARGRIEVFQQIASDGLPLDPYHETPEELVAAWNVAHSHLHPELPCDGWHSVPCPYCAGTGIVGIRETLRRWWNRAAA